MIFFSPSEEILICIPFFILQNHYLPLDFVVTPINFMWINYGEYTFIFKKSIYVWLVSDSDNNGSGLVLGSLNLVRLKCSIDNSNSGNRKL